MILFGLLSLAIILLSVPKVRVGKSRYFAPCLIVTVLQRVLGLGLGFMKLRFIYDIRLWI